MTKHQPYLSVFMRREKRKCFRSNQGTIKILRHENPPDKKTALISTVLTNLIYHGIYEIVLAKQAILPILICTQKTSLQETHDEVHQIEGTDS